MMKPPLSNAAMPIDERAPRPARLPSSCGRRRSRPSRRMRARADGERELGAGAEAGMGGNGAFDLDSVAARERPGPRQQRRRTASTRSLLGAVASKSSARVTRDLGRRRVDGEADRAVDAPEPAVQIEEAQMQARGRRHASTPAMVCRSCIESGIPWPAGRADCLAAGRSNLRFWLEAAFVHERRGESNMSCSARKAHGRREVKEWLAKNLPHWRLEDGWIRRTYKTAGWKGTLMVINTVGHLAEAAWHHPDITASYAWVEVRLHDAYGEGHHRQGPGARQEDRGRRPLAAGEGRRRARRHAARATCASPTSSTIDAAPAHDRPQAMARRLRCDHRRSAPTSATRRAISREAIALLTEAGDIRLVRALARSTARRRGARPIRTGSSTPASRSRPSFPRASCSQRCQAVEKRMGRVRERALGAARHRCRRARLSRRRLRTTRI